ncbi:MAG TPA: hypothetical protein PKZ32_14760, partial [Candidatus Melainabacteria bacterium]|nr:hypothetical protein [Candidatus Melainabacteria bacterium]
YKHKQTPFTLQDTSGLRELHQISNYQTADHVNHKRAQWKHPIASRLVHESAAQKPKNSAEPGSQKYQQINQFTSRKTKL